MIEIMALKVLTILVIVLIIMNRILEYMDR